MNAAKANHITEYVSTIMYVHLTMCQPLTSFPFPLPPSPSSQIPGFYRVIDHDIHVSPALAVVIA